MTAASPGLGSKAESRITFGARSLLFVAGVVGLAVGIFVIADPNRTLKIVAIVFGVYMLVWGLVKLFRSGDQETKSQRYLWVGLGLLGVAAGVVVLLRPTGSLRAVAWAFGIYLIALGFVTLVEYMSRRAESGSAKGLAALIDLAAGIVVVAWPSLGLYTLALILGVYLIVRGAVNVMVAFAPSHELAKV